MTSFVPLVSYLSHFLPPSFLSLSLSLSLSHTHTPPYFLPLFSHFSKLNAFSFPPPFWYYLNFSLPLSLFLSVCRSVFHTFVYMSIFLSIMFSLSRLFSFTFISLDYSFSLSSLFSLSLYIYLSVCLSVCLSLSMHFSLSLLITLCFLAFAFSFSRSLCQNSPSLLFSLFLSLDYPLLLSHSTVIFFLSLFILSKDFFVCLFILVTLFLCLSLSNTVLLYLTLLLNNTHLLFLFLSLMSFSLYPSLLSNYSLSHSNHI